MNKFAIFTLCALASTAAAQNCFETNLGTSIGAGDDSVLSGGPIGFNFPFNGVNYTDIYVSTNGFVYLANASTPVPTGALCCTGTTATLVASLNPIIAPLWHDLNVIAANGAGVYVNSSATGCIVTWHNVVEYGNTVPFELQCQLLPNGEIHFVYGGNVSIRTAGDALVGVSEGNAAAVPVASDFSVAGLTPAVTCFEIFNTTAQFDLGGQGLGLFPATSQWAHLSQACGYAESFGAGCGVQADSFYELFTPAASFDLANSNMSVLNSGAGYIALAGTANYVAPTAAATSLTLADDSAVTVALSAAMPVGTTTTSALTVCSNGFVSTGAGNTTSYNVDVNAFLSMPQTVFACWHDYNPTIAGSGQVKFEEIAGVAYVTWDGVFDYGTTGPGSTFQFQFDLATGNVNYVWGAISGLGNNHLVGYSAGGPSMDPGSIDLSVALPGTIGVVNNGSGLGLQAAGTPSFGSVMSLDTVNIPSGTPFGATLLGFTEFSPAIDLTSIGMPGCYQYVDGLATLIFLSPSNIASTPFGVPNDPAFLSTVVVAQSVSFSPPLTPLGAISSNGLRLVIGN